MNIFERIMEYTRDYYRRSRGHVAILWSKNEPQAFALASVIDFDHYFGTPIVNLLQSPFIQHRGTFWISASYPPTEACLGMASLLGIKRILFLDQNAKEQRIEVNNDNLYKVPSEVALEQQHFDTKEYQIGSIHHCAQARMNYYGIQKIFTPPPDTTNLIQSLQGADETVKDNFGILLAFAIVEATHGPLSNNPNRRDVYWGQNIASILVDSTYAIRGWGLNTNKKHPTLHGEINLIRSYQLMNGGQMLPQNGRLLTTLEPCAMCSGMIIHCAGSNNFTVVCGQGDGQVTTSALRRREGRDGETNSHRAVQMVEATVPIHTSNRGIKSVSSVGEEVPRNLRLSHKLSYEQASLPGKLMPSTKFLELHAKELIGDARLMLEKSAALWVPTHARRQWRDQLQQFLDYVRSAVSPL